MKKIFFLPVFILLILSLIGFVFAEQKCSLYFRDDVKEEHCANCGNGICEAYEECTSFDITCNYSSNKLNKDCVSTADCGGLYCSEDCKTRKDKCTSDSDCPKGGLRYVCSADGKYKDPKIVSYNCVKGTCIEKIGQSKAPSIFCENGCKNGECVIKKKDCVTDKECWDKFKSCYYKCSDNLCIPFNTILPIGEYPDCEKESCDWEPEKDYGACELILGVYYNGEKCVFLSGCDSGEDVIPFDNLLECQEKCEKRKIESICGNNICEEGEADEYIPGGCGANADPRCLGPPALFKPGSCPKDCKNKKVKIGKKNVKTELEISEEKIDNKTKVNVKLSNGKSSEIKIMPETASEKAIEVLKLKVCSEKNNCTIELKEVGKNNEIRAIYKIEAEKQGKFLGLFKIKSKLETQIDAESGEVIKIKKPWWNFLVFEARNI